MIQTDSRKIILNNSYNQYKIKSIIKNFSSKKTQISDSLKYLLYFIRQSRNSSNILQTQESRERE